MRPAIEELTSEQGFPADDGIVEHCSIGPMMRDARAILSVTPDISSFEQIGGECHYRFDYADGQFVGQGEFCTLFDGGFVQIVNGENRTPRLYSIATPDVMRIRIASEGSETYAPVGGRPVACDGPSALMVLEPAGQPPARAVLDGRQRLAYLFADREGLQRFCQGREEELPAVLQAFLRGELERTTVRRIPVRSELLRCLDDLQRCEHDRWTRTLFMRSKATELLCHVLKALELDEGFGAPEASLATSRGVLRAQHILADRFASPPTLDDLARDVGLSRSSLCAGFRQILGQPVFGYIQDRRMERTLTLLNETQLSISEIAHTVGYSHLSSFTAAVQRRFGMSPSDLRRTAL